MTTVCEYQCQTYRAHGPHSWGPNDSWKCKGYGGNGKVPEYDNVDHPKHYNVHPSGVECIDVVEHFSFNVGNAIKYLWRAGEKDNQMEDLAKAKWYVEREIYRLEKANDEIRANSANPGIASYSGLRVSHDTGPNLSE